MNWYILFFLLYSGLQTVLASITIDSNCQARLPSLYEQYCCVEINNNAAFLLKGRHRNYFFCPHKTPPSCSSIDFSATCSDILTRHPAVTSGYYKIALANGTTMTVYCDMEGGNCDGEGGWMRVAYLNMFNPAEKCPPGFRLYSENGIRACGRQSYGCQAAIFPTYIRYSQVCGRVTGYQKGSPDVFSGSVPNIHAAYVDGISITAGNTRKHIWTLIAAKHENGSAYECPCALNSSAVVTEPEFVGNEYFCESGSPEEYDHSTFYTSDPLWDGKQCGLMEKECCNAAGIPWFDNVLDHSTTDYIELRVCGNQAVEDEDSPFSNFEIYIK